MPTETTAGAGTAISSSTDASDRVAGPTNGAAAPAGSSAESVDRVAAADRSGADGGVRRSRTTGHPNGGGDGRSTGRLGVGRRGFLALGGTAATLLAGCSALDGDGGSGGDSEETAAIRAVIEANAEAFESEDLDAYMATMHPESPLYESTEEQVAMQFDRFDFAVTLQVESISVDGDTATAEVQQTTRETSGAAEFQEYRIRASHELRPYQGEWRIYQSTVLERETV